MGYLTRDQRKEARREKQQLRKEKKEAAASRRKELKGDRKIMLERRKTAVYSEKLQGFEVRKRYKYRLIVQPQLATVPQPTVTDLTNMAILEKTLGRSH